MSSADWYIIHTLSGSEKRVKQQIQEQAAKKGMSDCFKEIVIPSIEVPEIKRGKKVMSEKKFMPGYMLIKMEMNDDAWHLVKNTAKVTGFLGNGSRPMKVPEAQIAQILSQIENKATDVTSTKMFEVGEAVKVVDGPFDSFTGVVEEVDVERSRLRLSVTIFGRSTPLDLEYSQVEKV